MEPLKTTRGPLASPGSEVLDADNANVERSVPHNARAGACDLESDRIVVWPVLRPVRNVPEEVTGGEIQLLNREPPLIEVEAEATRVAFTEGLSLIRFVDIDLTLGRVLDSGS